MAPSMRSRSPLRLALFVGVVASSMAPALAADAQPTALPSVDVIKVEGPLDRPLLGFVNGTLDDASARGATVVLELDSAGGIGQGAVGLADRIAGMPVPVIVWVGPVPARASGGAMLLMLASSLASVAPGSQTGPLDPVDLLHPDAAVPGLDARINGWLRARGRTVDRTHEDEALDAAQALRYQFAEVAYPSVLDLLNGIDGRKVPTASGPARLHTHIASTEAEAQAGQGVSIRFGELGPVRRVEHAVASPTMIYVLLVFGLACLAFETTQPGFGFAGFAGLFLLALAAYGITVVPPTWLGLGVLLAGLGALALDVRLRRFGVLTWGGTAVFALGSVLVYGRVADPIRISPWLIAGATITAFLFFGFGLTVAIASRDRIVSTQRGLIGLVGEARGKMAPDGPVFVKGALWRGRSLGEPIAIGTRVRVRGVDGLVLKVEPETEPLAPND
jgi:membrane-bound serine protease (ClpP class)